MDLESIGEELLTEAESAFKQNFPREAYFEHILLTSKYAPVNNVDLELIPLVSESSIETAASRTTSSILAEAYLCSSLNWQPLLSVTNQNMKLAQLRELLVKVTAIAGKKIWLNTSPITRQEIDAIYPYAEGILAPLTTINRDLHRRLFPNKQLASYLTMLDDAQGLKRGISIVLGLGEKREDVKELHRFIESNHIDRVSFFPLHPLRNTHPTRPPSSLYMAEWIAETRIVFPKLEIVAATWPDRVAEVGLFLKAGANMITKFPALQSFRTEQAAILEEEVKNAHRIFTTTMTNISSVQKALDSLVSEPEVQQLRERLTKIVELMVAEK